MDFLKILLLVFCLVPSLTHGRHIRKLKKQQKQHENEQLTIENVEEEEKEAKKISSSLSSLKLNNIPHRIYLAGKTAYLQSFLPVQYTISVHYFNRYLVTTLN